MFVHKRVYLYTHSLETSFGLPQQISKVGVFSEKCFLKEGNVCFGWERKEYLGMLEIL